MCSCSSKHEKNVISNNNLHSLKITVVDSSWNEFRKNFARLRHAQINMVLLENNFKMIKDNNMLQQALPRYFLSDI